MFEFGERSGIAFGLAGQISPHVEVSSTLLREFRQYRSIEKESIMSTQTMKLALGFPSMSDSDLNKMLAARTNQQQLRAGCTPSGAGCGGYYA